MRAHHFGEGNTKSQGSHWRCLTFFVAAALLSSLTARRMEENKPLRNICVGQRNRQPVTPLFFGAETLAKLAGLTHDLGKYSLEFQERLQGKAQTVDHSTAGMAECCKQGAISAALAVAGHHAGLHVHSEALLGAVSLPLQDTGVQGQTIALQYQVTDLVRYFDDGGKWESLPGSFTGQASLQVNTSANQTFHHFAEEGEIKIHGVEATPSYTKIDLLHGN